MSEMKDMEIKNQYVQGYYRNKTDEEPIKREDGGVLLAGTMLSSSAILLAITYWKISLSALVIVAGTYGVVRYRRERKERAARPQLQVNYLGKSKTIYL